MRAFAFGTLAVVLFLLGVAKAQAQTPESADCAPFTRTVVVGNEVRRAGGQACMLTDGTLWVGWNVEGLPTQSYRVSPPPQAMNPPSATNAPALAVQGCQPYALAVEVAGVPVQAAGYSCWRAAGRQYVTQYTPGLPPQAFYLSAPSVPLPQEYAFYDPWYAWWPSVIVVAHGHGFRHGHFHRAFHGGMGHHRH